MKKLRLYFAFFFVLLAVPIAILLQRTYSNLEEESFFFYRRTAEGLMATINQQVQQDLLEEEQRPYTHYRYIHVADQPVPQQEGLNLSPLANFPVQSGIPGILGYYQIDPDGSFHTPLLPDQLQDDGIAVPQRGEREQVKNALASLLEGTLVHSEDRDRQGQGPTASLRENVSRFRKNLESNVDLTLEEEYEREAFREDAGAPRAEEEAKANSPQRRVQKASPRQALVFNSKLKDVYSDEADQKEDSEPEGDRFSGSAQELGDTLTGSRELDQVSKNEVLAEVDPFQIEVLDEQWVVFNRKVWSQGERYIQGFAADLSGFLEAYVNPTILNSPLAETASYLVFHQGEILQPDGGNPIDQKPLLLFSSALPHPLSDFQMALTVGSLPQSPGHQLVNVVAIFLSLLFIGGLFGIYRLTASQMELSQKKSDFVSAVSHELKTPLTAIRMYGEVLMQGWVEEEKKERYYQHIHDESERLSRLIQNVLTLAQLERKEWQVNLAAQDPVEFVTGVVEQFRNQVQRAGFEITTAAEGEPKPIQVDSDALTQILINLIDNAIKFSKQAETKKIVVTVSQPGGECYIRVRDFGPGIPGRKLKKIFQRFYRMDNEMTRTTRGTGIGLALVKMLADAMGAHVDVANRRPGAEFSIRFPAGPVQ